MINTYDESINNKARNIIMNIERIIWHAPEYFSRWRLFPRAFITMYIYLLYDVTQWFMALPDPNTQQAGLVSVIVGAGAAWFGLYVNSSSTKFEQVEVRSGSTTVKASDTRDTAKEKAEAKGPKEY
tara:strand:+ start:995 stop:1372 length:378 start_codon:yes stop_codon:yes gene_type:complete